ncbi:MAG TPA: hypothetical protein VFJ58_21785 [Armatimonadota bacterium]|nr:hypothetical protein [Armatimonadota bacterium]
MIRAYAGLWLSMAALAGSILAAQAAPPRLTSAEAKAAVRYGLHANVRSANYVYGHGRWSYEVIAHKGSKILDVTVDPNSGRVLREQRITAARERRILAKWSSHRRKARPARRARRVRRHR